MKKQLERIGNMTIGAYNVEMLVDEDGHLNIYVESVDGSALSEVDTSQDTKDQYAIRFTTEAIEAKARS